MKGDFDVRLALAGMTQSKLKRDFNGRADTAANQDFQKYLGKIGSTRDGAFAMGVTNGRSDGWASSTCGYDTCYGGNSAVDAMRMCREGGECVLFARDQEILINYKVEEN